MDLTRIKTAPLALLCLFLLALHTNIMGEDQLTLDDLLETKIETAARYEQTVSEAPASITIITREDINRFGYRNLDEVLNTVPGFYVTYDRNYSAIGIRGFGRHTDYNNRLLVMLNGLPINDNYYNGALTDSGLGIDLKMVERVEVVRGPNSALYGIGAMLGVINIITRSSDSLRNAEVSASAGNFNTYETSARYGREFSNGASFVAGALFSDIGGENIYFKDFDLPPFSDGLARDLDWDQHFNLFTQYKTKHLAIQFSGSSRDKGIPTSSYGTIFNDPRSMTKDGHYLLDAQYKNEISPTKEIAFRTYFQNYFYEGVYPYDGLFQTDENDGRWFGGQFQYRWDVRSDNRLVSGVEFVANPRANYAVFEEGLEVYTANDQYSTFSFYLQDEWQILTNLSLTAGVRHDRYSFSENSTSPRGAIIFHPNASTSLKLLYGKGFRAPNVYERTYQDINFTTGSTLNPEKIETIEAIVERKLHKNFFMSVAVYRILIKDLIDLTDEPFDSESSFVNAQNVKTKGIELALSMRSSRISAYANYSFGSATGEDNSLTLTNSPEHLLMVGFYVPLKWNTSFAAEMIMESERKTLADSFSDSFAIVNMNLKAPLPFRGFNANGPELSFRVTNLFNSSYALPGGFEHTMDIIPQPSRQFTLEINYGF